jgi:myo-inositol 2-dehydrogenase/D-chiro-inositol 1-dehydrogenase
MNTTSTSSSSPTRRDFLKASGAAVSLGVLGAMALQQGVYAAGSDILKVGMIGCGGRNTGAGAQALSADKGTKLVAMCDIFMDRVKGARDAIKGEHAERVEVSDDHCFTGFDSYKKVIELSDVVCIANAAKFHPIHAFTAIQAGKHVFVEKPHGIDPMGCKLMQKACDLAKQKNLGIMSGLHSRHHPGYAETVKRVWDGAIGEIISIEENFLRAPYVVIPRKQGLSELEWQCSTQYHFRWLSGDDVPQSLVHNMDRASWAMKNAVPIKCHGLGGRSSMTDPIFGDVFDHHSVVYEYPNGIRAYAFCRTTTGCYDESSSMILGSKGKASITSCQITGPNAWQWKSDSRDSHAVDPYQIEHDKLFAGIRSGKAVNSGDHMAQSTMTTVMGQLSCYTGKEVTWEQVNKSDYFYPPKAEECRDDMEAPSKLGPNGNYPVFIPGQTQLI